MLVALSGASGCSVGVLTYQPLTALQNPVAIERASDNFAGQRIELRCVPSRPDEAPALKPADAQRLCTKLSTLFTNQGAQVDVAPQGHGGSFLSQPVAGARPDLVIEVKSRVLHEASPPYLWLACFCTGSLIPAYRETSIAQDVSIRDADGFELASESYQARFVEYVGISIFAVNRALDYAVREEEERVVGGAQRDFSRDFYRQLTQLAFNARVRAEVLRSFEQPGSTPAPKKTKAIN